MQKHFAMLAIAATLSASAVAGDLYVGADIGRSEIDVDVNNGYSVNKNDTSFALFGGVKFHPNFAVEVAYRDLGELNDADGVIRTSVSAYALQASLLGSLPVSNELSLFGRLGLANINSEYEERGPGYRFSEEESKTKALFGVGARYAVNKQLGLRAEYNQYAKIEDVQISTLTVGVDYHF